MKIVQINAVCGSGSTGKICVGTSKLLTAQGVENYIFYSDGSTDYPLGRKYMTKPEVKMQALKSRILGNWGFNSQAATKRLIGMLEEVQPDVVHLHNLHSHNCDLESLFRYFRKKRTKLFWTFHDCWTFTGYCMHYDMAGCARWKTGCYNCSQKKEYSWFADRSSWLYQKKKELFTGLDLTVITPSRWLAEQVKESFLKDCPVYVVHNGIDLEVFRPRESEFRKKYDLEGKFVILGVAFGWKVKKGLDVFIDLAKRLDDSYRIVLVGTDATVERQLPANVIPIRRTQNQQELAEIYTAADVFVNPTREDSYPTVNMEAIACGTPVITFDTGGSPEIPDAHSGCVIKKDDVAAMEESIRKFRENAEEMKDGCRKRVAFFDEHQRMSEMIALYTK